MKITKTITDTARLIHVRGGMYRHDRTGYSYAGVRLSAESENDKNILMIISEQLNAPVLSITDDDDNVTEFYIDLLKEDNSFVSVKW